MTTALLFFLGSAVALTSVAFFIVNQVRNAPIGFENETGFHYGEPQPEALASVVAIKVDHRDAA